jgi:hypothetical protein
MPSPIWRALSSANLLRNLIGIDQAKALATILKDHSTLKSLCGNSGDETGLVMSGKKNGVEGAIMLAPEIIDNGAMTILNMSKNDLRGAEAGKALGDALAGNTVLKELNLSGEKCSPNMDIEFVKAFTPGLPDNGALSCANLLKNGIDADQANALVSILKEHPTLKSLCGNKGDETALDMSGRMYGVGDAIMIVPEIIDNDNGAMTSLDLSGNRLKAEGAKVVAEAIKGTKCTPAIILASL